jgi:hypothetical protein
MPPAAIGTTRYFGWRGIVRRIATLTAAIACLAAFFVVTATPSASQAAGSPVITDLDAEAEALIEYGIVAASISWTVDPAAAQPSHYRIELTTGTSTRTIDVAAPATDHVEFYLDEEVTYEVTLFACVGEGATESCDSATTTFTTPALPVPRVEIDTLTATATSPTSISATWSYSPETNIDVVIQGLLITPVGTNEPALELHNISSATFTWTGATPGTTYQVDVYGCGGPSPSSLICGGASDTVTTPTARVVVAQSRTITEGDSGSTTADVTVTLSHPSTETVTVDWATVDSNAQPEPGVDYEPGSGTLEFGPGETSKTIPFTVHGDLLDENTLWNAEWGGIVLSNPTNAELPATGLGPLALVLILDDDPPPTIEPGVGIVLEGDAGTTTTVEVPVTLSAPSGQTVTVDWVTAETVQPAPGVDFVAASGTVTFLPGETTKTVAITVHGDNEHEPGQLWRAEWGAVSFSSPTNATFGNEVLATTGPFLILDDDVIL